MQKFLRTLMLAALFLPFASQAQTCDPISTFPVTYGFEASEGFTTTVTAATACTTNVFGSCWRNEATSGTATTANRIWHIYGGTTTSQIHSGAHSLILPDKGSSSALHTTMLTFPAMNFTNPGGYVVSFWIYRNGSGTSTPEGFKIYASSTDTIGPDAVELGHYSRHRTMAYPTIESASGWYQYETTPITMTGTVYIIFEGQSYYSSSTYIDDVVIDETPTCFKVSDLAIDAAATTSNSMTLTWSDARNTGATYSIYNMADTSLVASNITATTYTVNNLAANTAYTFGVMTDCGGGDVTEMVFVSGRTACAAMALPWTCGFEADEIMTTSNSATTPALPWCSYRYVSAATSGTTYPYSYSSYAHNGSRSLYFYGSTSTSYPDTMTFILPELDVTTYPMNANRLTFWARMSSTSYDKVVYVGTLTDPTDPSTYTFVGMVTVTGTTHTKYSVPLTTATATAPYVCVTVLKGSGSLYIDDMTLEEMPSCLEVTGVTVSNITSSSITLNWVDAYNASASYSIYDMADTSLVASNITDTTYTVTGLNSDTQYNFGIQANCSAGDAPFTTVSGRTACAVVTMPWSENFDTWESKSPCWSFLSGQYNGGNGTPTASTSAWTLNTSYGDYITISGKAMTMNLYSTNKYWAVTPFIEITDDALLSIDLAAAQWSAATPNYDDNDTLAIAISTDGGTTFTTLRVLTQNDLNALTGTYSTLYVPVSGYTGDTVRFAIYGGSTSGTSPYDNRMAFDNVSVTVNTGDICYAPTNLTVSNITTEGATLTWNGTASGYNVYVITAADTTLDQYVGDTTVDLTNLDAMTSYTYGVRAVCGNDESPMVTVSFNTPCVALTLPYTETFETTSNARGCWIQEGSPSWSFTTGDYSSATGAYEGTLNAKITASDRTSVAKLISPALDLEGANGIQLTFAHIQRSWSGDIDNLHVLYRTSAESAWMTAAEYTNEISTWTVDQVLLPATTYQVAFEFHSDYGYGVAIDSVVFTPLTDDICFAPAGLAAINVTADSARLTWNSDGSSFNVYLVSATDTTWAQTVSDTTALLENLLPNTQYTFGVANNCTGGESDTVYVTFRTSCTTFSMPFSEDFNTLTSGIPSCWDNSEGTITTDSYKWNYYATGHDGVGLRFNSYSASSGQTNVLVTPAVAIDEAAQVSFWYKNPTGGDFTVMVGIEGSATRTTLASGLTGVSSWTLATYLLPDSLVNQNVVVYFMGTSNWGSGDAYIYLDDLTIEAVPTCMPVTDLTVSDITAHTATLHWISDASSFNIYNVTATDTTFVMTANDTNALVTGLMGETQYKLGVTANCSGDESPLRTVTFTTLISCPAPTGLVATLTPGDGTVATVSWNAGGEETAWQVCLNDDMDNIIDVTDSTYSFTGLTPEVAVTVKVRAVCDIATNDMSAWRTVVFTPTNAYTITVNDGTTTNSYVPVYGMWVDNITKSQFVIPATDLTALQYGNITKLTFYASQENVNWGAATFNVYLTETTATGVSALADYTDMTQVYAGTLSIVNNKMEVNFTTPYTYMGGNLMVGFLQTVSGSWSSSSWYGVSADGASMGGYNTSVSQRNFLPKTTIDYTPGSTPSCMPISNLAVDSVSATSVSLSWTDEDNTGATYTVYNMADSSVVATGIATTNYTVTGLTASTGYTFGVVANCSATDASLIRTVAATTDCAGGSCQIAINGVDSYGDGWNGASLTISQNGATVGTFTLTGSSATGTFSVCSGVPVTFTWNSGSFDDEASFEIVDGGNATVYTVNDASTLTDGAVFFTMADACPSCIAPVVNLDSVSLTTVSISWTGTAASYALYNGTTFVANVTTNSYTFTGLTAATSYTFGVQAICSTTDSSSIATVNAMTACADITTLPYNEGFENGLGCWTTINGSADGQPWSINNCAGLTGITPHGGSYVASSWSWSNSAMHANAWLISPKFVLPTVAAGDSLTLAWWEITNANYPDSYSVVLSTSTNDTAAFTTVIRPYGLADTTGAWALQTVDLTAYAGQSVYIAFHHQDYDMNYLLIDDIALFQGAYVPPAPDTLTVTFAVNDATMGTTVPAPGTYQYLSGDTVSFNAVNNAGHRFDYWLLTYGTQTDTVTYQSAYATVSTFLTYWGNNVTLTAVFEAGNPDSTTITYAVNDATMGTINPTGTHTIYVGDAISATATPNTGYALSAWVFDIYLQGTLYGSDTITADDEDFANPMTFGILSQDFIDYDATITVTALFDVAQPSDQVTLTFAVNDPNMGSINPTGTHTYNVGDVITITATPNQGYHLAAWMMTFPGQNPIVVTEDLDLTITDTIDASLDGVTFTAVFEANAPNTITITVVAFDNAQGEILSGNGNYTVGQTVTLSARAFEGYKFVRWSYNDATENPYTFTVTQDMIDNGDFSIIAYFEEDSQGIDDIDASSVKVFSVDNMVVVNGAENQTVSVYDVNGRRISVVANAAERVELPMPAAGVYLVKVGNLPAQRVAVVR